MRFLAYIGLSAIASISALAHVMCQRPNFFSMSIHISQSNACLMILTNLALAFVSVSLLGLQKLLYGPLRPVEREQLYEKAWFAITETCLAMTVFRDELGSRFLAMFVGLLVGKVGSWISEARIEGLEQQPPARPTLYHFRLMCSLCIFLLFDTAILIYAVRNILREARPNMMVMFGFEFAVLVVTSTSLCVHYCMLRYEAIVVRRQSGEGIDTPEADEMLGWEEKGSWLFCLDICTDFLRVVLYLSFFGVLCFFYGMPLHIVRDVALTLRSFYKRVTDYMHYKSATRDMESRYPDASSEEIRKEDTCIICRDTMHFSPLINPSASNPSSVRRAARMRPKKLTCGHVLHLYCLKSWLERQQNCPTCRSSVIDQSSSNQITSALRTNRMRPPSDPSQVARNHDADSVRTNLAPRQFMNIGPLQIRLRKKGRRQDRQLGACLEGLRQERDASSGELPGLVERASMDSETLKHDKHTASDIDDCIQNLQDKISQEIANSQKHAKQLCLIKQLQKELQSLDPQTDNGASAAKSSSVTEDSADQSHHRKRHMTASCCTGHISECDMRNPESIELPQGWTICLFEKTNETSTTSSDYLLASNPSDFEDQVTVKGKEVNATYSKEI